MDTISRHQCLIYEGSPSKKLEMLAVILKNKLDEGYRCLYLNSVPMIAGMRSTLSSLGMDVAMEIAKARVILSSESTSKNGEFNSSLLLAKLEDALNQAVNDGYKGLWASGDMTWEFGPSQDFSKLMEYELGLEEIFNRRKELCGICQYHLDTLPHDALRQSLLVHPHVVINETLSLVNPNYLKSSWPVDSDTKNILDEMLTMLCKKQGAG